jgi:tetratricopeptide (TPR) repeat protein
MNDLGDSYAAAGRGDEALRLLLEALALSLQKDPDSPASARAYAQLGFRLDALGRGNDAIKAWQEAVRIDPVKTRNTHYWLGKALVDRQRYAEALPILRATRKFYPDGERSRDVAERLALVESKAETEKPPTGAPSGESVTAWLTGLRQWVAASPAEKVTILRQAVAANPADVDQARHLATIHLWLGQRAPGRLPEAA